MAAAETGAGGGAPPLELERKRLSLRVLLDTAQELSGMMQPKKIVETFLLTAMGPIGARRGVAVLARPESCEGLVVSRGLPGPEAEALEQRLADICDAYFPYTDTQAGGFAGARIRTVPRLRPGGDSPLPSGMEIVFCFGVDESHCGLLALGSLLAREDGELDQDAWDLLHSLLHILIGALRGALAVSGVRQLSVALTRKNERLAESLAASQAAQRALDRRMHQMAAINELAGELAHLHAVRGILDSFLLTMLGAFSVGSGLALVLDREAKEVSLAVRGAPDTGLSGFAAADQLVYKAFASCGMRSLAPLTVAVVAEPEQSLSGCGLPFEARLAVFFALDCSVQGVLALGETISGEGLAEEDAQLARTQVATLLGFVQGARHLATITALNEDLTRQNEELTRTVAELTEARRTIDILERAGARVRAFLQAEGRRSARFSWLDCGAIVLAAALVGFLFNLGSPNRVPLVPEYLRRPPAQVVSAQKARELQQGEGALIVDARPQAFFEKQRIRGAVNLPPALFDMVYLMRFSQVPLSTPIVVYGGNLSRRWDEEVAARLAQREHERVVVMEDGLAAWAARGYPVEP